MKPINRSIFGRDRLSPYQMNRLLIYIIIILIGVWISTVGICVITIRNIKSDTKPPQNTRPNGEWRDGEPTPMPTIPDVSWEELKKTLQEG